jgi:hypothetical protein
MNKDDREFFNKANTKVVFPYSFDYRGWRVTIKDFGRTTLLSYRYEVRAKLIKKGTCKNPENEEMHPFGYSNGPSFDVLIENIKEDIDYEIDQIRSGYVL